MIIDGKSVKVTSIWNFLEFKGRSDLFDQVVKDLGDSLLDSLGDNLGDRPVSRLGGCLNIKAKRGIESENTMLPPL